MRSRLGVLFAAFSTLGAPTHAGECAADLSAPFGELNFFDLGVYLTLYNAQSPQADFAPPTGVFNFFDLGAFLEAFNEGCGIDSDFDGLLDEWETNDGVYSGPTSTGTDPFNPDTDNDGLLDGDEVLGTEGGLDLPALGADPLRKDIFVECDWYEGEFQGREENYRPTPVSVGRVVQAFANAPVANPYGGASGISIHLDYGQGGPFTGGNQLPGSPDVINFGDIFYDAKADHFDPARKGYFHYAIFANRYNSSTNSSSGIAEINGDDFIVTMVNYFSEYNQSQTIVHELGHNLGLRHGGFENRNYKRNYNSVMNYRHQFPGADTNGDTFGNSLLDYSAGVNNSIDENAVDESAGVLGIPVDFNSNGVIDAFPYARNLNCGSGSNPCGSGGGCYDSTCDTHFDFDDWSNINWNRLNESFDRREMVECDNWPGKATP